MKTLKSFLAIFMIALSFVILSGVEGQAQGIVGVKSYNLGTIANTVWESYQYDTFKGLLKEFGCTKIDSIIISMTVEGEADVDTLNWYPVNWTSNGTAVVGTVKTFTVTLNVAAAGIASSLWRGYEGFTWRTRGAASGNDATDPNNCKVTLTFFGS